MIDTQPPHRAAGTAMGTAESLFQQRLELIRSHGYRIADGFFVVRPTHELTMLEAADDMLLATAEARLTLLQGGEVDLDALGARILEARTRIAGAIDQMRRDEPGGPDAAISPARLMDIVHEHGYPITGPASFADRDGADLRVLGLALELHLTVQRGESRADVEAMRARLVEACAEAARRENR